MEGVNAAGENLAAPPRSDRSADLEFQPGILIAAARAADKLQAACGRIEMLAANATKGRFLPGMLKQRVIPPVIIKPKTEEEPGNEQAVNYSGDDEIHPGNQCLNPDNSANRTGRDTATNKDRCLGIQFHHDEVRS